MTGMQWVLWMIAVAVLGLAAVAASGRLGELPGTVTDTPRPHVPTGVLTGAVLSLSTIVWSVMRVPELPLPPEEQGLPG